MPKKCDWRHSFSFTIDVFSRHWSRSNVMMRRWPPRLDCLRSIEFKCPKWQIVKVTSKVGHRTVPKIPPSIPLRTRKVDWMKWSFVFECIASFDHLATYVYPLQLLSSLPLYLWTYRWLQSGEKLAKTVPSSVSSWSNIFINRGWWLSYKSLDFLVIW